MKPPVSLRVVWCKGLNSIRCQCNNCNIDLSANMITWLILISTVAAMCITGYVSIAYYEIHDRDDRLLFIALLSIPALFGSAIGYFLGGYRLKGK